MRKNQSISITAVANGFVVAPDGYTPSDRIKVEDAVVFTSRASLLNYIKAHFKDAKGYKETITP